MSDQQYTLDLARPDDLKDIAKFINTNFFLDVPVIRIFGIEQVPSVLERNDKPDEHTAFIVKATSASGDIIGVAVNRSKDEEWPITEDTDEKTVQFVEFIHFVDKDAKLSTLPERTVELYILSVAPNWRCKGIAKRLGDKSITVAKQKGFDMMKICCANEFTMNIAERLGFQEFYKLAYSDYNKLTGKNIKLRSLPPHHYLYYYVKNLKE